TILNAVRLLSIRTRLTVISAACSLTIIINPTDDIDQRHGELHIQRNSRQRRQLRTQFLRCDWDIYMIVSWVQAPWHSKVNVPASITVIVRSEEHTSELQSRENLVCRLLLEKK